MSPSSSTDLITECKKAGWSFDRQRGDHFIMTKPGQPRPIVIPLAGKDVARHVASNIRRQLKASQNGHTSDPKKGSRPSRKKH